MNGDEIDNLKNLVGLFEFHKIGALVLGLSVLWLLIRGLGRFGDNLTHRFPGKRLFVLQIVTMAIFSLYIFGGTFVFYASLRPSKELLITLGGSAAVAIGLSLKDLVSSLIAGIILLFDRPFQVGDRVTFGDTYGEIRSIGLRAVRLVTLDDNLVTIPNSKFVTEAVASGNAGAFDMMVVVPMHVALEADLDTARRLLLEVAFTSRYAYLAKPPVIVASEVATAGQFSIKLDLKMYVFDVKYEKALQTDVIARAQKAFLEADVRRPARKILSVPSFQR